MRGEVKSVQRRALGPIPQLSPLKFGENEDT